MPPRRKLSHAVPTRAPRAASPPHNGGGGAIIDMMMLTLRATCALPPGWAVNPVTLRSEPCGDRGGGSGLMDAMPVDAMQRAAVCDLASNIADACMVEYGYAHTLTILARERVAHLAWDCPDVDPAAAASAMMTAAPALRVSVTEVLTMHLVCAAVHAVASNGGAGEAMEVISAWHESRAPCRKRDEKTIWARDGEEVK
eukprot:gene7785-15231_t